MVFSTGIWCKFSNNLYIAFHSLLVLCKMAELKLASISNVQKHSAADSINTPLAKKPYLTPDSRDIGLEVNQLVMDQAVQQILRRGNTAGAVCGI